MNKRTVQFARPTAGMPEEEEEEDEGLTAAGLPLRDIRASDGSSCESYDSFEVCYKIRS